MEQSQPNPESFPRVIRVEHRDGLPISASEAPSPVRENILAYSEQLRQHALETLPDHEGGAEVARIDAFFEHQGLRPKPAKILTPGELPMYRDELARIGYSDERLNELGNPNQYGGANMALYLPQLGLTVAVQWPDYRGDHGAAQFQAVLAHEKAHSTTQFGDIAYMQTEQGISYSAPRVGQTLYKTGQGVFLEEGFADYMAAQFVKADLSLPNGAWPFSDQIRLDNGESIPPVYVWPDARHPGKGTMTIGAFPAYGLELINQKDPRLNDALIEARKSAKGLRQVAQIIEGVKPGLYTELRGLGEHPDDFMKGLRVIQAAVA